LKLETATTTTTTATPAIITISTTSSTAKPISQFFKPKLPASQIFDLSEDMPPPPAFVSTRPPQQGGRQVTCDIRLSTRKGAGEHARLRIRSEAAANKCPGPCAKCRHFLPVTLPNKPKPVKTA
jgi:hypothetical protein